MNNRIAMYSDSFIIPAREVKEFMEEYRKELEKFAYSIRIEKEPFTNRKASEKCYRVHVFATIK